MIHLDTNYLVGLVTRAEHRLVLERWLRSAERMAVSSIVWSEFLTGPVTPEQVRAAEEILEGRIIPFGTVEAVLAGKLFNHAGRRRALRIDSFIAAAAICSSASLATDNRRDFLRFSEAGLRLA